MAETMEQYMSKTRDDYGSRVARPKIEDKDNFELKGQFLKELRTNTFSGSDHEDANEHIKKVLEIIDLFHIPNITIDQVMLRAFPMSLTGAASRWLRGRNSPLSFKKKQTTSSITTWDDENRYQGMASDFKSTLDEVSSTNLTEECRRLIFSIMDWDSYSQNSWTQGLHYHQRCADGKAIQAQLNNLGREIKKVNEKVYAAQVGC
ncbi:hypothetical protein Tco_0601177 [Tanacetum coccineum]